MKSKAIALFVFNILVSLTYIASAQSQEEQKLKIAPEKVFGSWDNDWCYTGGEAFNNCAIKMAVLVYAVDPTIFIILRSELSKEWAPVKSDDGREILRNPFYVLVRSTELRKKRLTELSIMHPNRYYLENKPQTLVLNGLLKRKFVPKVNFAEIINTIYEKLITEENRDIVTGKYLLYSLQETDPFLSIAPVYSNDPPKTFSFPLTPKSKTELLFSKVTPLGPLDRAGIAVGDRVLKFNGDAVNSLNFNQIAKKQKNNNKKLIFTIQKADKSILETEVIVKKETDAQWVKSYSMKINGYKIGVININSFIPDQICDEVKKEILKLKEEKVSGLIYDLRGNQGGQLAQSLCLLGLNLGENKIIGKQTLLKNAFPYTYLSQTGLSDSTDLNTQHQKIIDDFPLVTIIDSNSASATEFTSGILRYFEASWIVGQRSYGKGIGQDNFESTIHSQTVLLKETFMRLDYLDGSSYHGRGIEPDFIVGHTISDIDGENFSLRLSDYFNHAFETTAQQPSPSPERMEQKKILENCVKQKNLNADPTTTRWLQDQQLRKSAQVALCNIENPSTWKH